MATFSSSSSLLLQDAQGRWDELLSPTQVLTGQQTLLRQQQQQQQQQQRKQCHGNQKLRRFRTKCRKQGMNETEITKLINEYNHINDNQRTTTLNNKRKQMTQSSSQHSFSSHAVSKKIKAKKTVNMTSSWNMNQIYWYVSV